MRDIICELQDMKHLDWAARKMSPGTPGCFLKAYEEVKEVDVMRDFPVNNYIGAKSLEYNLTLIPKGYDLQIQTLKREDRDYIFRGVNYILSEDHINKIWEMIWNRWCYFEQIRNQEK